MFNVIHIPWNRLIKYCVCIYLFQRIVPSNCMSMCICEVCSIYHIMWVSFYNKLPLFLISLSTCIYFVLYLFIFLASVPSRERKWAHEINMLCAYVCVSLFQFLDQLTTYHKIWYKCYAFRASPSVVLLIFPQSVVTAWWMHGVVKLKWH